MSGEDKNAVANALNDAPAVLDTVIPDATVEQEEEDEYLNAYEALEQNATIVDLDDRIKDYHVLLQNPRYDEQAIKIKEQSIYR